MDLAGAEMLAQLHRDLAARGIAFRAVEARASVRDMLVREGLDERLGHIGRGETLAQVLAGAAGTTRHGPSRSAAGRAGPVPGRLNRPARW